MTCVAVWPNETTRLSDTKWHKVTNSTKWCKIARQFLYKSSPQLVALHEIAPVITSNSHFLILLDVPISRQGTKVGFGHLNPEGKTCLGELLLKPWEFPTASTKSPHGLAAFYERWQRTQQWASSGFNMFWRSVKTRTSESSPCNQVSTCWTSVQKLYSFLFFQNIK